ncbi:hypothetical protein WICPIJ_005573 [Wickerhamomyces pijperi]|uniref:Ubiquitin-like domain-containing protein n=1 Tax=Wickerhamomyces pijperi TaxID=599730 RepID=A0A9P8Q5W4_WICPI|nr:hypothetical protein WICPIJ_005573 [Wickerhamomyces pijperi]
MSTELDFAQTFLSLLSTTNNVDATHLQRPQFITAHPPQQPKLPIAKQRSSSKPSSTEESSVAVVCKSIRPPRFAIEVNCSSGETVYNVKTKLTQSSGKPANLIDASQLKFLIKGKVIQDSTLLSSLINQFGEEIITFTVMISEYEGPAHESVQETPAAAAASTSTSTQTTEQSKQDSLADADWETVHHLLTAGNVREDILERVRKGWNLTK